MSAALRTREPEHSTGTTSAKSLQRPTLVLNADYSPMMTWPLSIYSAREAIEMVLKEKASIVEAWPGEFCRSASLMIEIPKVVVVKEFAHIYGVPKFTRRNVWLRDKGRCQYCGDPVELSEYTFDHVVPKSRGGKTAWTNILTCCSTCNAKKGNKDPQYSAKKGSGLRPLKEPRQPTNAELIRAGLQLLPNDMKESWADYLYWSAELRQ